MRCFNVGPDDLTSDLAQFEDRYEWVVYWYESGDYDGGGEAVALRKDGKIDVWNLSHCSCYGPLDEWDHKPDVYSVEEFLRDKENIHDLTVKSEVEKKARRLLFAAMRK